MAYINYPQRNLHHPYI